jgi:MscS family membrane protein
MFGITNLTEHHEKILVIGIEISTVLIITLVISFLAIHFLNFLEKKLSSNSTIWDDLLLSAIKSPLTFLIWIIGAIFAAKIIAHHFEIDISHQTHLLINLAIIFSLSWFGWNIVKKYEQYLKKIRNGKIAGTISPAAVVRSLKVVIIVILILMVMQNLGVSITGLIAFGGIGGLAIGFAAKDLLANFFGTAMISFDYPFSVGDWIRSPDRQIEGIVEHIGLRLTHIRSLDKRVLYIPNSVFSNIIVENPSRMTHRRILETIRLRYEDIDKVEKIILEIREMLNNRADIEKDFMVNLTQLAEASVNFFIDIFTYTKEWRELSNIKQDILLQINFIVKKHQAKFAIINPPTPS